MVKSYESIKSSANQLHRTGRSRAALSDAKSCTYQKPLETGEGSRAPSNSVGLGVLLYFPRKCSVLFQSFVPLHSLLTQNTKQCMAQSGAWPLCEPGFTAQVHLDTR